MNLPGHLPLAALEAVANGVLIVDRDGVIVWVNQAFSRMTGYSPAEAVGRNPRVLKSGAHPPSFYRELWTTIVSGEVWTGEMINRRKDGSTYFEEQTITPVRDARGAITHFIAIKQDVSSRRRAEDELRESEHRYRLLAENVTDVISVSDVELRLLYVSPSIRQLRGFTQAEAMAQSIEESMTPSSLEALRRALAEELAIEQTSQGNPHRTRTLELELLCKEKPSTVWAETKISLLREDGGRPSRFLAISRDITERKRLEAERVQVEEQLRQAQKMEAIGHLAGGIAHDFNNLLTVIIGRSQIARHPSSLDSGLVTHIQEIESAALRAAALTRQLLIFSRQQITQPRLVDLNAVVTGIEKMLRRVIGEDIDFVTRLEPGCGAVKADPSQLEQILLNLAVNARDAMPRGGRLIVETANVDLDEAFARTHPEVQAGAYVALVTADTGHGMDAVVKARIFEPFFTTKKPGKGTGLGLATVHGIVKQSGGSIWVSSEVGEGTTFTIYFPRLPLPGEAAPSASPAAVRSGTETILLVEDDERTRALLRDVLAGAGYTVLMASGPDEALAMASEHVRIDLMLTDVIMPGMTGVALGRRLERAHPEMSVLYMSGYPANALEEQAVAGHGVPLLQKPFTINALTDKVREVLEERFAAC